MQLYFNQFQQRTGMGFHFSDKKWPVSGAEAAVEAFLCAIYGDSVHSTNLPTSEFYVRRTLGGHKVTLVGRASMERSDRVGVHVEFVLCIPENDAEETAIVTPAPLFSTLNSRREPGALMRVASEKLPVVPRLRRASPMALAAARAIVANDQKVALGYDPAAPMDRRVFEEVLGCLPAAQQDSFGFVTYCYPATLQQMLTMENGVCVVGTEACRDAESDVAELGRQYPRLGSWLNAVTGEDRTKPVGRSGCDYPWRLYPQLLFHGLLEQPVRCADWFSRRYDPERRLSAAAAQAAGMALSALESYDALFYPTREEKQWITDAVNMAGLCAGAVERR